MIRPWLRRALDALLWAALGVMVYFVSFSLLASLMFALAPYAALLVGWATVAPCLGGAERSRAGVAIVTGVLALPAGIFMMLVNDGPPILLFAPVWISTWIGLLVPRLVVPRLAPGAFARRHAATPAE